ncbi:hypothetical protein [Octadecabacter antarcticus]|uniref:hypothetical protein n=1 Tax=Octadecabacter antarcticus TaxID=1217908 RepID=UPI0001806E21|nr:hypothetical protein [Octadecabacter antarcticus]
MRYNIDLNRPTAVREPAKIPLCATEPNSVGKSDGNPNPFGSVSRLEHGPRTVFSQLANIEATWGGAGALLFHR